MLYPSGMDREKLRESYKPSKIRLLLMGESAPASGRFFYQKSLMTVYTSRAFEEVFEKPCPNPASFLDFFRATGCYLDDLSVVPVDKMTRSRRERVLKESIEALAGRIRDHNPGVIAIVLKRIEPHVREAIRKAGVSCPVYTLPFPGNGHQSRFIRGLVEILKRYIKDKI